MKKQIRCIHRGPYCLLSWLLIFPVAACGLFDQETDDAVIEIGSIRLTREALKREMAYVSRGLSLSGTQTEKIRNQLVRQIIDYYLIMDYGRKEGISVSEDEFQDELKALKKGYEENDFRESLLRAYEDPESWESRLRNQLFVRKVIREVSAGVDSPSYEEIKAYYDENRAEFRYPEMLKFRQIVCGSKKDAQKLRGRLMAGEDMGELAKEYSIAPEAENRGQVGWIARGDLEQAMEKILFSLQKGRISPVVKTGSGYHLFEVMDRRRAGLKELAEVMDDIESRLLRERRERFCETWLKRLRAESDIKINQELLTQLKASQPLGP